VEETVVHAISNPVLFPAPVRALATDEPSEILGFAVACFREGIGVALATLVEIRGGAARMLGSNVVVAADGRFCGYVSGGCVEAAVAAEAMMAMEAGRDRTVMFGDGSPFIDIALPCGGGISVSIHCLRHVGDIEHVLACVAARQTMGLRYTPERQSLDWDTPPQRACWRGGDFLTVYRPRISGHTIEAETVARIANASGYDVVQVRPGDVLTRFVLEIDAYTAIVVLHHDLDQEAAVLDTALRSCAFYIGALGSTNTHRRRVDRLKTSGYRDSELRRIKAPIGLFGPARDASSLALSVLADIAASRLMAYA
jgi:xanthine dehydrogenase accessory factor